MIRRLLVANRAEIASRVFRTCRALGIETVAVHSDADAGLPYVAEADFAVRLPGSTPAETYLDAALLVEVAGHHRVDAIHPGYGFLSENADFARAVEAAGLTWVGPTPASIEAMGSKIGAKQLMRDAGVPTLEAPADPTAADLPLLVKASAGGGGRGMRVVRDLADLEREVAAAEAEALSAFGDGTVFVEPYVELGRHVEVQVVGDGRGGVLVLGERDCSVQRRHQKVVEESPAPDLPAATRTALHDAARAAAAAIDYRGAGTVELLYDQAADRFFFLEMNTRLQVEHPVTELVHGVDLVAMQLEVAEGAGGLVPFETPRPSAPQEPTLAGARSSTGGVGHAIEVRLYAEDPAEDYQPQSGRLTAFEIPVEAGVRVDAGYAAGDTVSTFYDAMLAKVVVHAPTRTQAARRLAGVLRRSRIHGVRTNRDQLVAVLTSADFLAGRLTTRFLDDHPELARPSVRGADAAMLAATAARVADLDARRTVQAGIPTGWRNVVAAPHVARWDRGFPDPDETPWLAGDPYPVFPQADFQVTGIARTEAPGSASSTRVDYVWEGVHTHADVTFDDAVPVGRRPVDVDGAGWHRRLHEVPRFVDPADAVASGSLLAPMPGSVVSVLVTHGAQVTAGQPVLVLEAMKMQHTVTAPHDGTVVQVDVTPGTQVAAGEVLAVVEEA
ncbi:ATP-binding protein [Nocardioides sp. AX2bis]|uniref:ATP-binding protein n=1 Tax=Nocardioides sp. AX2bis TaxID=2653157 RepID=UPI00135C71C9|nr:biotin carboxylase N-terminal domain-containing protein [Nocardioides sp. AX2bis]